MKRYLNIYQNGAVECLGMVNTKDDIVKLLTSRFGMTNTFNNYTYLTNFVRYFITEGK